MSNSEYEDDDLSVSETMEKLNVISQRLTDSIFEKLNFKIEYNDDALFLGGRSDFRYFDPDLPYTQVLALAKWCGGAIRIHRSFRPVYSEKLCILFVDRDNKKVLAHPGEYIIKEDDQFYSQQAKDFAAFQTENF